MFAPGSPFRLAAASQSSAGSWFLPAEPPAGDTNKTNVRAEGLTAPNVGRLGFSNIQLVTNHEVWDQFPNFHRHRLQECTLTPLNLFRSSAVFTSLQPPMSSELCDHHKRQRGQTAEACRISLLTCVHRHGNSCCEASLLRGR